MALPDLDLLSYVPPRLLAVAERYLKAIPVVRGRLDKETGSLLAELEGSLKPYKEQVPAFDRLPAQGRPREEVLRELEQLEAREQERWKEGLVSGAVYHGAEDHIDFVNRVYALHSQSNPLHADLWPSATKFEAEVVAMTASMLGATEANAGRPPEEHVCGSVSSGGTESIMLAMKTYRDWARATRRITRPELVAPTSAHPAFDKAAHYFGIKQVRVPVGPDYRADVAATRKALTRQHHRARRLGAVVPARGDRSHRGAVGAGARAGRRLPHGRVPGRLRAAVGEAAGVPGAAVRLPAARGDEHVRGHAQVRLRGQGHLGGAVPGHRAALAPVLHRHRVAGRASTSLPPSPAAGPGGSSPPPGPPW